MWPDIVNLIAFLSVSTTCLLIFLLIVSIFETAKCLYKYIRQDVDAGQGLNLMFEILNSNTLVGEST